MRRNIAWFMVLAMGLHAADFRIVTPYAGSISNRLAVENMDDMKDTALMHGLYFQWVNPARYQWNVFLYQSRNINESDIFGSHFIFDYYVTGLPMTGKFVIGAGLDYIRIRTDGDVSAALSNFCMTNAVYAPYFRLGRYLNTGSSAMKNELLVWTGYERDIIRGDIRFDMQPPVPQMPAISVDDVIESDYDYALLGLNIKSTFHHFLELSAKYYRKVSLNGNPHLNTFSGMVNCYLNRHWGLSYRFKYMEVSVSTNTYHIGGIAYIF
ncbi:hypothetical protein JW948_12030 [bacterium]|nr:hypothetical protein [bacterium]